MVEKKEEKKAVKGELSRLHRVKMAIIGWIPIIVIPFIVEIVAKFLWGGLAGSICWHIATLITFIFVVYLFWEPNYVWFTNSKAESATGYTLGGKPVGIILLSDFSRFRNGGKGMRGNLVSINHPKADEETRVLPGVVRFWGGWTFFLWPIVDIRFNKLMWTNREVGEEHLQGKFREESTSYISLKLFMYRLFVLDIDDSELGTFSIDCNIYNRVVCPWKVIFSVHDPLAATFGKIEARARHLGREGSIDDQWKSTKDIETAIQEDLGDLGDGKVLDSIVNDFGRYVEVFVHSFDPSKEKKEMANKKAAAKDQADIFFIEAQGKARATRETADAEVYKTKTTYAAVMACGDAGLLLAALNSMKDSSLAASYVVANVPGLKELFEKVGVKEGGSITGAQIVDAQKIVEETLQKTKKQKGGNP